MPRRIFFCAAILIVGGIFPGRVRAERSLHGLWLQLFHRDAPVSTEESALAPAVAVSPVLKNPLQTLRSRHVRKRLAAIEAIQQSGEAGRPVIEALIKSTQDKNPDVSRRATEALLSLCRSGHAEEVIQAFSRAVHRRPRAVPNVVHTGFAFKIPDRAEEQRVQNILNRDR
jgi:DNA mismatch repair protein MutH